METLHNNNYVAILEEGLGGHHEPNINPVERKERRERSQVFGLSSWIKPYLKNTLWIFHLAELTTSY